MEVSISEHTFNFTVNLKPERMSLTVLHKNRGFVCGAGMEPRTLHMQEECSTDKLYPHPTKYIFTP